MNEKIIAGQVFKLKEMVDYKESTIEKVEVVSNENMKFILMAFDEEQELSTHKAPGDAIVFALDGAATIVYEGEEFEIKEGENFRFKKDAEHSVKANERFKMALMISL